MSLQGMLNVVRNITKRNSSFDPVLTQIRGKKHLNYPKKRFPTWFLKKERVLSKDEITPENAAFIKDMVHDKYGPPAIIGGISTYQQSPLKNEPMVRGSWTEHSRRTGLIAKKIGQYPMWLKNGTKIHTTLLQVVDNHVIKYTPPEEYKPTRPPKVRQKTENRYGRLLVGAGSADPQLFTKEYCGLFTNSGVMPKQVLSQFMVSPEAAIQPGTPLYAMHFQVGDFVDVRGLTVDRGFQGVMKRHGFSGMPASHGVTKTHRRGGNIGGGGEKGRVWPGTKMPGHMGNRHRIIKGLKIWRINTIYNVLWVQGIAVAGDINSHVYIYDTILPLKKRKSALSFPTYFPEDQEEPLPEDIYEQSVHPFTAPSISFHDSK